MPSAKQLNHLELIPLFAKIDAHVGASDCEVGAAAVEAQVPHLNKKHELELKLLDVTS